MPLSTGMRCLSGGVWRIPVVSNAMRYSLWPDNKALYCEALDSSRTPASPHWRMLKLATPDTCCRHAHTVYRSVPT